MFYIPHFHYHIDEWAQVKDATLSALHTKHKNVIDSDLGEEDTLRSTYREQTDGTEFQPFISIISPYLERVSFEIQKTGFYNKTLSDIKDIWYQVQNHCEYHPLHNHGFEGWSAVFYAEYDQLVHESTKFYCPLNTASGHLYVFQPDVKEGDLVIFPSQINHESVVNTSDKPRSIISFNLR